MNKLIFTSHNECIFSYFFENDVLYSVNLYEKKTSILNNIYVGRVVNIVKNIDAAFVEISDGIICYLSLLENKNPFFLNNKNTEKICVNDLILVQVKREAIKSKRPMASCNIEIAGEYCVVIYGKTGLNISTKINNTQKKKHLKELLKNYSTDEYGFIIRTNAQNASDEIILEDVKKSIRRIKEVIDKAQFSTHKTCIYLAPHDYLCDLKNLNCEQLEQIIVDDKDIYNEICDYIDEEIPTLSGKIRFYEDEYKLENLYNLKNLLSKLLKKNVWLKSGGSIVIEPTETLTAIDVNTGKAIFGKKNSQDTFYKINIEAATEIARQIRLRNISGIIIVDFIDMERSDYREELIKRFRELLEKDPVKTVLVDMTQLNLIEVTRKKIKQPLHEKIKNIKMLDEFM